MNPAGDISGHPLGQTAAEFARGAMGGADAGLVRYARLFRAGDREGLECPVAPIGRVHTSESHEGTVVKFTQVVPRHGPEVRATKGRATEGRAAEHPGGDRRGTQETLETESVLIPMIGKRRVRAYTLCVSSQVGCAMGCTFCQTAQMGLVRQLSAHEIVQQWFAARWMIERPDPEAEIRNIVFMGMGEPLDNYENVMQAIRVLTDHRGPSIAPCRVTISTVGRVDGLKRLREFVTQPGFHRLGMAISLNAPDDATRGSIMPINRKYPLATLREALVDWPTFATSHLCLEYVLIPGVNDSMAHADQLAAFVKGNEFGTWPGSPVIDAVPEKSGRRVSNPPRASSSCGGLETRRPGIEHLTRYDAPALKGIVNLIPYNPREQSPWPAPTEELIDAFMTRLTAHGVYCKRRRTKGRDQMAACGQLGNLAYRRKPVKLSVSGA